jgi:cytochrome c oxidase subunit 3
MSTRTAPEPRSLDVSDLPTHLVDARESIWWGNLGMIVIEGTMFAMFIGSYFYLRGSVPYWPPDNVRSPELVAPTANLILLLVSLAPMIAVDRAAKQLNETRVKIGLSVLLLFCFAAVTLRFIEFNHLRVHFTNSAYGSVLWTILGFHAAHLIMCTAETIALLGLFVLRTPEKKHFLDARMDAVYWYFIVGSWVVLYTVLYVSPRFL